MPWRGYSWGAAGHCTGRSRTLVQGNTMTHSLLKHTQHIHSTMYTHTKHTNTYTYNIYKTQIHAQTYNTQTHTTALPHTQHKGITLQNTDIHTNTHTHMLLAPFNLLLRRGRRGGRGRALTRHRHRTGTQLQKKLTAQRKLIQICG